MDNFEIVIISIRFIVSLSLIVGQVLFILINWKTLQSILSTLPEQYKKISFNTRTITDERLRFKKQLAEFHFLGCLFFAFSIVLCVIAILGFSLLMLDINAGFYQSTNYQYAIWALAIAILSFIIGLWFTSLVRLHQLLSTIRGKQSYLFLESKEPQTSSTSGSIGMTATMQYEHMGHLDGTDWTIIVFILGSILAFTIWILSFDFCRCIPDIWKLMIALAILAIVCWLFWATRNRLYRFIRRLRDITVKKSP